jgi:acyl-CoA thioesterase
MTDARQFLGMEELGHPLHWRMPVVPEVTTPGNCLFGRYGLGAALVALEVAGGRPTVWSTAHYLSYAPTGSVLDLTVTLAAEGRRVTQARAVGLAGDTEILIVNAALGLPGPTETDGVWDAPPSVPPPDDCPPRRLPSFLSNSIFDRIDVRVAKGRTFEEISAREGTPGDRDSALWARVPGHLEPSAATLAILGDYVTGALGQTLGRRRTSRSLDSALRVVRLEPTECVLCDIRIQALAAGYRQGTAFLWSESGSLLATASQSMSVRFAPPMPYPSRSLAAVRRFLDEGSRRGPAGTVPAGGVGGVT